MNYTIPLPEALKLAAQRRAERYASAQADLDELRELGCTVNVNAAQLVQLEEANLLYDFETGLVEDFRIAPDNPRRVVPVAAVLNRQPFYTEVAQTLPAVQPADLLQEMTREMTAAI